MSKHKALARAAAFCETFNIRVPILMAPMAGACPASLAIAIANAGGLGGCGALLMQPDAIRNWAADVRAGSNGGFQLNLWIPDPPPKRDAVAEETLRRFLNDWGPEVAPEAGSITPPDFEAQCEAMLEAGPQIISSIMGPLFGQLRGADEDQRRQVVRDGDDCQRSKVRRGRRCRRHHRSRHGGWRTSWRFRCDKAEARMVGLFSLLPAVVDAVKVPVVAAGGIADGRGVGAALLLGASAVQVGTAFLRCPEARVPTAWADAIGRTAPEETMVTRVFSGRPGRSIATAYVRAATAPTAPPPVPYPVQRGLTQAMRDAAVKGNDIERIQAWAGQSAGMARTEPAGEVVRRLWEEAEALLT